MKKILALILSVLMTLALLTGCQEQPGTTQTPTQSPEEQAVLKILTIGNSHSNDATWLLGSVFEAEAPDQKLVLGTLYVSGCNMSQHADFVRNNKAAYEYFKNTDGTWNSTKNVSLKTALLDEQWDIVVMQQMNHRLGRDSEFVAANFKTVINCILENQEVTPKLAFHMTWTNPDDYALYLDDSAPLRNPDPMSWRLQHENWFRSAEGKYDQSIMYNSVIEKVQKFLVDTTEFLGKDYYDFIIPSATAIEYLQDVLNRPQPEVYRDYTHLNDYGRLVAAYLWYAQIMGIKSIDKVNVEMIMPWLHQANSQYPSSSTSYAVDEKMKTDLIASVNWVLAHPYELPAK